ncbi:MAG: S-layer homology domain-containing protein [Marinisporobacter sp.]|jgi:hypothetical protein|nr:S-layer homology domain-containing protein [Marinisporobacter sp.]
MYKFENKSLVASLLIFLMIFSGLVTPISMENKIAWAENTEKKESTVTEAIYNNEKQQEGIWEAIASHVKEDLVDIWKSPDGEVFVLGQKNVYKYKSGEGLSKPIYHIDEPNIYLHSIWGTSSKNIYAVGGLYSISSRYPYDKTMPNRGSIRVHYNGTEWKKEVTDTNLKGYYDIAGTREDNIFVAGEGRLTHFDGDEWIEKDEGRSSLMGLHVKSEDDIYILGMINKYRKSKAGFRYFDGNEWKEYISTYEKRRFTDIFVKNPNEIYLAGREFRDKYADRFPAINAKFDGTNFTEAKELLEFKRINDFWTKDLKNTYAVGYGKDEEGIIYHHNGNEWKKMDTIEFLLDKKLNCIMGIKEKNLLVVGDQGTILEYKISDKKDLKVSKIDVTLDVENNTSEIDALVSYTGKTEAENVTMAVYGAVYEEDDYDFITKETINFEPNSTNTIKIKDLPIDKVNNKNIKVAVDALNIVEEEDEENNILQKYIKTDLSIGEIRSLENREKIYKTNEEGAGFQIGYTNNGNVNIKNIDIVIYENDKILHKFPFEKLPNKGNVHLDKWTPKSGTIQLKAVIDENHVVTETNEENNEKSIHLKVAGNTKNIDWIEMDVPKWHRVPTKKPDGSLDVYEYSNDVSDILVFEDGEIYVQARSGLYKYEKMQGSANWKRIKKSEELDCVWGNSSKNIFTAKHAENENFVEHFNGEKWEKIAIDQPVNQNIKQVWGSSREDIYIKQGFNNKIYHYNGENWTEHNLGFELYKNLLIAASDDIYALAKNQKIYHNDGKNWSEYRIDHDGIANRQIKGIYLDASNHLCIAYNQDLKTSDEYLKPMNIACFDGTNWKDIPIPFVTRNIEANGYNHITRIFILNKDNIYLMKDYLYYYDGQNWNKIAGTNKYDPHPPENITDGGLERVIGFGSDKLFVVGDRGRVWYRGTGLDIEDNGNNTGEYVDKATVHIRVEGYDKTFVPRTSITVDNFDLTPYLGKASGSSATESKGWGPDRLKNPTVAHVIIEALKQQGFDCTNHSSECDLQDYGWSLYMAMIGGDREFDHRSSSGWMYRVNGWLPNYGCQGYSLDGGEDILWYFGAYGFDTAVTEIKSDKTSASTGEKVEIKLKGAVASYNAGSDTIGSDKEQLIEDATIYVNGKPYEMAGKEVKTDKEGKATLIFYEPGNYTISAERINGEDLRDIVRPLPIHIQVGGESKTPPGINLDVEAIEKLLDLLNKDMDKINTVDEQKKVVEKVDEVKDKLKDAVKDIKNEKDALKVLDKNLSLANVLGKLSEKITDKNLKKEIGKIAQENMKTILKGMDQIQDQKEINKIAASIIDIVGKLTEKLGEESKEKLQKNAVQVAEKAIEKSLKQKISRGTLKVEKEKVVSKIDSSEINRIIDTVTYITKEMKDKLKENKIEDKIKVGRKLAIEIPSKDKEEVELHLASDMMKKLKENHIEQVILKTEMAVFNLTKDTFAENKKAKEVVLHAKVTDTKTLTPLQRHKVPKGCLVVDLNAKAGKEKISNFNEPISVSIPYKGKVKKGETVQVFLLNDNGTIESMGGTYDSDTKMVTFTTPHFSKYFAKKVDKTEVKVTFKDLAGYEWAREAIEAMAKEKIINGRKTGIFEPSANITRAEFATLVTKIMGYTTENINIPFKDAAKDAWYYDYVGVAYKNGLINGRSEIIFDPNGNITRQEMAVIVAKVLEKKGYEKSSLDGLNIFKDTENIAAWAKDSVSLCVKEKIISGMGDGSLAPKQNANRAQAATMLYKIYNLINK